MRLKPSILFTLFVLQPVQALVVPSFWSCIDCAPARSSSWRFSRPPHFVFCVLYHQISGYEPHDQEGDLRFWFQPTGFPLVRSISGPQMSPPRIWLKIFRDCGPLSIAAGRIWRILPAILIVVIVPVTSSQGQLLQPQVNIILLSKPSKLGETSLVVALTSLSNIVNFNTVIPLAYCRNIFPLRPSRSTREPRTRVSERPSQIYPPERYTNWIDDHIKLAEDHASLSAPNRIVGDSRWSKRRSKSQGLIR